MFSYFIVTYLFSQKYSYSSHFLQDEVQTSQSSISTFPIVLYFSITPPTGPLDTGVPAQSYRLCERHPLEFPVYSPQSPTGQLCSPFSLFSWPISSLTFTSSKFFSISGSLILLFIQILFTFQGPTQFPLPLRKSPKSSYHNSLIPLNSYRLK